ncbi:MAG: acyltransferase [Clostridium sp.]|nr:acyltransferase [Clostridium sp.]
MKLANEKKNKRIEYFDVLRVTAMFAVILNHTWGYFSELNYPIYNHTLRWQVDNVLLTFTRFDVPIFLMISGALLLDSKKNNSIKYLFKNRLHKILVPFITWDIIYIIIYRHSGGKYVIFKEFIKSIFSARDYAGHLWYLYVIVGIYLITPLLSCFVNKENKSLINYMLLLWIVFGVLIPFFQGFFPGAKFADYANLNLLSGYVGYYVLGYKLANTNKKFNMIKLFIIFIIGWFMTAAMSYFYQNKIGGFSTFPQNFTNPNIVIMSFAIFAFIRQLVQEHKLSKKVKSIILNISYLSFGIYLIHYLFRNISIIIFQKCASTWPVVYMIISPMFVFFASYISIFILSKINILSFCMTGNKYKKHLNRMKNQDVAS